MIFALPAIAYCDDTGGSSCSNLNSSVDLSVGSAIPSDQGAILENPAALDRLTEREFNLAALANSFNGIDAAGTMTAGKGNVGYGAEIMKVGTGFDAAAGFAAQIGNISVGVSAETPLFYISPIFNLGLIHDGKNYSLSLVLNDLNNFGSDWILGFGFPAGRHFRFGLDLEALNASGGIGITGANIRGAAEFYTTHSFSVKLSYGLDVMPSLDFSDPGIGAGFSLWLSKKVGIYAIYNMGIYTNYITGAGSYTYEVGLKIL